MSETLTQIPLIPDEPVFFENATIPLSMLPPDEALVGPAPSRQLLDSIQRHGIIEPVVLQKLTHVPKDDPILFTVLDGRRRIKAARQLGIPSLAARLSGGPVSQPVLTVAMHATRSDNVAAEVKAVLTLLAGGRSEQEIARATGLAIGTIRHHQRLGGLHSGLLNALYEGRISATVAEAALKLPGTLQIILEERIQAGERITAAEVKELRRVEVEEAARDLPADIFGGTVATQRSTVVVWREQLAAIKGHIEHGALDRARQELEELLHVA